MRKSLLVVLVILVGTGAACPWDSPIQPVVTAESFCSSLPNIGTGNFFYCGTTQGNLQTPGLPAGSQGYCEVPVRAFNGLVGFSPHTSNGGAAPVYPTLAEAEDFCTGNGATTSFCNAIAQCTRQ